MCKNCNKFFIWKNSGTSKNQKLKLFYKWIIGKQTLQELSKNYNKSIDALRISFQKFLDQPIPLKVKINKNCYLIIDATYFKKEFCLIDYYDYFLKRSQYYRLLKNENFDDIVYDLRYLKQQGLNVAGITSDGHKALTGAIKQVFPDAIHQRCIIHIQRMSLIYLTRFPKSQAGKDLRILVKVLHKIDNKRKRNIWIKCFNNWCQKYNSFLQEKSQSLSGRKWYTHKLIRRTRSLIKNALPDMFHYLDNSNIQKSTNGLESRFSYLKNNLKIHRGLTNENRKKFILWYMFFKSNF